MERRRRGQGVGGGEGWWGRGGERREEGVEGGVRGLGGEDSVFRGELSLSFPSSSRA